MRTSAPLRGAQLLSGRQALLKRPPACSRQAVLAAGGEGAGDGGGARAARPRRDKVAFLIPGQPPLQLVHITQRSLSNVLVALGALGFETAAGCSQELEDLPEGGEVQLVLPPDPPIATQVRLWLACLPLWQDGCMPACQYPCLHVHDKAARTAHSSEAVLSCCPTPNSVTPLSVQVRNLQRAFDNSTRGQERQLEAFLLAHASAENAGAPITVLPTTPFKGINGQVRLLGPPLQLPLRMCTTEAAGMALPPAASQIERAMIQYCWRPLLYTLLPAPSAPASRKHHFRPLHHLLRRTTYNLMLPFWLDTCCTWVS